MMVDVDIGLNRPANLSLEIQEKLLVMMGEVYIVTSNYYSINGGTRVDVEGRCGYRYQTSHSYSHNPGNHGRFST